MGDVAQARQTLREFLVTHPHDVDVRSALDRMGPSMKRSSYRHALALFAGCVTAGCTALTSQDLRPSLATRQVALLPGNANGAQQKVPTSAAAQQPVQPLSFQTSGMRGAIDEGGYSASTDGVADSLVREMTSMLATRSVAQGATAGSLPCAGDASIFATGLKMLTEGSIATAKQVFDKGVAEYPRSVPLRIGAGVAAALRGKADIGVEQFLAAADIDPADGRPYPYLAAVTPASDGIRLRVMSAAARYLASEPGSAEANYFEALMLSRQTYRGDNEHGISLRIEALCRRTLELDPSLAAAHLLLGRTFSRRRAYLAAIREYQTTLRLQPSLAEAYYPLALAYYRTQQPTEAKRAMQRFVAWKATTTNADMASALASFSSIQQPGAAVLSLYPCGSLASGP